MAWTTPKDAVGVTEREWMGVVADEAALRTTSTTTILRAGPLFGSDQLRMFGDMAGGAKTTMGGTSANAVWVDEDLEGGAALVGQPGCDPLSYAAFTNGGFAIPFTWIESGGVFDIGSLTLGMDERRLTDRTSRAVTSTCVPRFAQGTNWPWDQRVIDTVACTYTPTQGVNNFYVFYKDACVVPVPAQTFGLRVLGVDGKADPAPTVAWLMIAARVRVATGDTGGVVPNPADPFALTASVSLDPGHVLTDIVCFCADDDAFTQNVRGPFCLVHACEAIADNGAGNVQAWLGVPGATWVDVPAAGSLALASTWLYVYYVVEPEPAPIPNDPAISTVVEALPNGVCSGGLTSTLVGPSPLADSLSTAVSPGIAVRRFRLSDIHAEVVGVAKAAIVPEASWAYYAGTWAPVTGECLGYVQLYVGNTDRPTASTSVVGAAVPFREWIGATSMPMAGVAGDTEVRPVDPMPLCCDGEPERPTLFFAALPSDPGNAAALVVMNPATGEYSGHGIWTGRSLLAGETLVVESKGTRRRIVASEPGTIFWIDGSAPSGRLVRAAGQVAHAPAGGYFVDPDPVILDQNGTTRVYFGQGDTEGNSGPLQLSDGDGADACPNVPLGIQSRDFPWWVGLGAPVPQVGVPALALAAPVPLGPTPLTHPLWVRVPG